MLLAAQETLSIFCHRPQPIDRFPKILLKYQFDRRSKCSSRCWHPRIFQRKRLSQRSVFYVFFVVVVMDDSTAHYAGFL
jgi:hypothetical protein